MSIIIGVMEEGLIYAIMALGLYITYKILDFPDLSVDGTFPMGAAVTAMLILKGVHPVPDSGPELCGRTAGRMHYRSDPCEAEGTGPALRHHHDDSAVLH